MNPVLWRELRVAARRPRTAWSISAGLWLCLLIVWFVAGELGQINTGAGGSGPVGRVLVGVLVMTLATLIALIAPLMAARAMLIEQRRKTFDLLIITPLSARAILRGKLLGALVPLFVVLGATLPLAMALRLYGGFTVLQVLWAYLYLVLEALVFGQLGLAAAILSGDRRRLGAVMLVLMLLFVLVGTPILDTFLNEGILWWLKLPFVLVLLLWLLADTTRRLTRGGAELDDYTTELRNAGLFMVFGLALSAGLAWDISNGGPTLRYFNPLMATAALSGLPLYFEPARANFGISLLLYLILPGAIFPMLAARLQAYFNTESQYQRGLFF